MWIHTSLLLLLILLVLALSCPASSLDSSPTASPASAHAPASNGSQDPALRNTSAIDNPAYAFSRGFDKSYQRMTILISTLFIAFVCFGFCAHYVTFRSCYTHTAATRRHNVDGLQANEQDLTGREGAPGLEPWLVRSLPVVKYSAQREKQDEGTAAASMAQVIVKLQECAVCLSEFEEGEEMKELPVCRHRFHKACIDMWLFSHTTCPICRLSLRKHFKDGHTKSSMDQSSPNRLPQAAPRSPSRLPRGPHIAVHLEVTVPLDVPAASTSSAFHAIVVNADDVDDDEAEHARNSSAALYQRFPSSA